jgi:hypothetical protein
MESRRSLQLCIHSANSVLCHWLTTPECCKLLVSLKLTAHSYCGKPVGMRHDPFCFILTMGSKNSLEKFEYTSFWIWWCSMPIRRILIVGAGKPMLWLRTPYQSSTKVATPVTRSRLPTTTQSPLTVHLPALLCLPVPSFLVQICAEEERNLSSSIQISGRTSIVSLWDQRVALSNLDMLHFPLMVFQFHIKVSREPCESGR